ncbi:MAG: putative rane protein [Myxococcales bacterium]|nr:putative rane protein [Myxococcales bacterium]
MADAKTKTQDNVQENIRAISAMQEHAERTVTRHQRAVEVVTAVAARPGTLYIVAALALGWAGYNGMLHAMARAVPDPPPFYWLQGTMALAALLLTIVVLATQRRQAMLAEQRAHLDLQVNLLSEQKIAKVVALLEELRRDLPSVRNRVDRQAQAMAEPADPNAVVDALKESLDD